MELMNHMVTSDKQVADFRQSMWSGGLSPPDYIDLFPKLKKPLRGKGFRRIGELSNEVI
jgi:hypothetical protein